MQFSYKYNEIGVILCDYLQPRLFYVFIFNYLSYNTRMKSSHDTCD